MSEIVVDGWRSIQMDRSAMKRNGHTAYRNACVTKTVRPICCFRIQLAVSEYESKELPHSSLQSEQSQVLSHCQTPGIHKPDDKQRNCNGVHCSSTASATDTKIHVK